MCWQLRLTFNVVSDIPLIQFDLPVHYHQIIKKFIVNLIPKYKMWCIILNYITPSKYKTQFGKPIKLTANLSNAGNIK